jgi:hypothetical protein
MARGKHSTALFEVINSGKKPPAGLKSITGKPLEGKAAAASLMRTPKWWFKGRPAKEKKPDAAAPVAAAGNDPTANVTAATLTAHRSPITSSAASPPVPVAPVEQPPSEPAVVVHDYSEPEPILAERFAEPEPAPATAATDSASSSRASSPRAGWESSPRARSPRVRLAQEPEPELEPLVVPVVKVTATASRRRDGTPSRTAVHLEVDRDRQEITLRMRYTTAIVSGFVVLVAIASAYVIGRHLGESASGGGGLAGVPTASTRQLRNGPAQPGVLDVGRDPAHLAAAKLDAAPKKPEDSDAYEDAPVDAAGLAYRTVNRNYVIIATFPAEKSDIASRACDFLCSHGITCTLERDVHGEPAHWLSVVGTRGFPHRYSTNKDYLAYRDAIVALNDKFPAKSNFGRFTSLAYKWDGN